MAKLKQEERGNSEYIAECCQATIYSIIVNSHFNKGPFTLFLLCTRVCAM